MIIVETSADRTIPNVATVTMIATSVDSPVLAFAARGGVAVVAVAIAGVGIRDMSLLLFLTTEP